MPDLVDQCPASPAAAETPVVLLEEVLLALLPRPHRRLFPCDLDGVGVPPPLQAAYGHDRRRLVRDAALYGSDQVGLVVDRAREPRDKGPRHELANEDDATAIPLPDVEAKVDLREAAKAGPRETPHPRVLEIEGDQARERRPAASVEREPCRY